MSSDGRSEQIRYGISIYQVHLLRRFVYMPEVRWPFSDCRIQLFHLGRSGQLRMQNVGHANFVHVSVFPILAARVQPVYISILVHKY